VSDLRPGKAQSSFMGAGATVTKERDNSWQMPGSRILRRQASISIQASISRRLREVAIYGKGDFRLPFASLSFEGCL
jgi:hypothetical protein